MMEILYSCHPCRIRNAKVLVRDREPNEDVIQWMEKQVIVEIGKHHHNNCPWCRATHMSEVKIPMSPGAKIGESETRH